MVIEKHIIDQIDDHECRIRTLEKISVATDTKLSITNKLLLLIATMIGGGIVTLLFSLLTKQITIGVIK